MFVTQSKPTGTVPWDIGTLDAGRWMFEIGRSTLEIGRWTPVRQQVVGLGSPAPLGFPIGLHNSTMLSMMMRSLGDLIEVLQEQGRLARVEAEVSAEFEVTEIARRMIRESGRGNAAPAVLFGSVRGSAVPLAVNLLADEKRIHAAFRVKTLDEVTARLERLLDPREPEGWFDRLKPSPHAGAHPTKHNFQQRISWFSQR